MTEILVINSVISLLLLYPSQCQDSDIKPMSMVRSSTEIGLLSLRLGTPRMHAAQGAFLLVPTRFIGNVTLSSHIMPFHLHVLLLNTVFAEAIQAFDGGVRVTDPANSTATAGIFATYPQAYLSAGEGFTDQVATAVTHEL